MKKTLMILLAALLILSGVACSEEPKPAEAAPAQTAQQPAPAQSAAPAETAKAQEEPKSMEAPQAEPQVEFKTLGDIWDFESPGHGCGENVYVRVFKVDGVFYRADAELTDELFGQVIDIDIFDEEAPQKEKALLSELPIRRLDNLSDYLLPQEALDSLAGVTGQELLDLGFVPSGSYGFSEEGCWACLEKGPFEYQFEFAEIVPAEEDPNIAEVIRPLTVKRALGAENLSQYVLEADFDPNVGRTLEEYLAGFNTEQADVPVTVEELFNLAEIPVESYEFKTLGEILTLNPELPGYTIADDHTFICVFEKDGRYYRAESALTEDLNEKLSALDFYAEDYQEQVAAIIGGQPIQRVVDLTPGIMNEEDMGNMIGMTGQDLLDFGFRLSGTYSLGEETKINMVNGFYEYTFIFNEQVPEQEDIDAMLPELVKPLTVKSVGFAQLSSEVTEPDYGMSRWNLNEEAGPEPVEAWGVVEIPVEESPFKTVGEAFECKSEVFQAALYDEKYIYVFQKDGVFYRVEADLSPELIEQLDALDVIELGYDEYCKKQDALVADLPVVKVINLSAGIPAQEELDALAGMTGEELLQMGFQYGSGYSFIDKAEMYLTMGIYEYHVFFNETVPQMEDYDAVMDEIMKTITVARVEFFSMAQNASDSELVY